MKLQRGARTMMAKPRRGFRIVPKGGAGLSLKTTKARGGRKMTEVENYFAIGTSTRSEISSAHHACYAGAGGAIEIDPGDENELNGVRPGTHKRNYALDEESSNHSACVALHRGGSERLCLWEAW